MVGVSASVNLPLHHKVQKFSSGTGSPGWSRKKGCEMVVMWCGCGVTGVLLSVPHSRITEYLVWLLWPLPSLNDGQRLPPVVYSLVSGDLCWFLPINNVCLKAFVVMDIKAVAFGSC